AGSSDVGPGPYADDEVNIVRREGGATQPVRKSVALRGFVAPGKGPWQLAATHASRPLTTFVGEAYCSAAPHGFARGASRYGLPVLYFRPAQIHGFVYQQPVFVGAPSSWQSKGLFWLLTRLHPGVRARLEKGAAAFERRLWRRDLRSWDEVTRPAIRQRQKHL